MYVCFHPLLRTLEVSDEMTPHLINYCYQARWVGVSHSVVVRIVLSLAKFMLVKSFVWCYSESNIFSGLNCQIFNLKAICLMGVQIPSSASNRPANIQSLIL